MYRRVLLSALGSVALLSPSFAADIYSPGPPQTYAAVALPPNWAGFYIGANGGYGGETGIGFRDTVIDQTTGKPFSDINAKTTIAGGFGGGQLGYNFQWGSLIAGLETDIEGSNIMGSGAVASINTSATPPFPVGCGVPAAGNLAGLCGARNDLSVDWFGTVRGRLGYAWGGTLLYVTGGFAYGGVDSSSSYATNVTSTAVNCAGLFSSCPSMGRVSTSVTRTGWAAGAGIETKLAPSWTLRGEYQFVDLGSVSTGPEPLLNASGNSTCPDPGHCYMLSGKSQDVGFSTVRIGVNYLFNAPEPLPLK